MACHSLQKVGVLRNQGLNLIQRPYSLSNTPRDYAASHFTYNEDCNPMEHQSLGDRIGLL